MGGWLQVVLPHCMANTTTESIESESPRYLNPLPTVLTKAHLPQLMTMLSDFASESFMLGIQLGFNDHLLRTLEHEGGCQSSRFLCSVLSKWLERGDPPPTLDKLVAATPT